MLDKVQSSALGLFGAGADALKEHFGMNALADWLLSRLLKDLDLYYDEKRQIINRSGEMEQACRVLRNELISALREETDHEIMVIAHSMGSIVAYDALRDLGQSDPQAKVKRLATLGSPLGLPHVKGKVIKERYYDPRVRTPSVITQSWMNFADKKDPVAIDFHLKDDFQENARGVHVYDQLVANDYESPIREGKRNHHKSYGYLRTPEFSRYLKSFLEF
jgi:pimeloyl-ACP methyl ester carboxylesterase